MPRRSTTLPTRNPPRKTAAARTRVMPQAPVAEQSLAHTSVGESTYRRVRADIVRGRLAPGQKLTLDRMRDAYGTAVSTLRELLNRLASAGIGGGRSYDAVIAVSASQAKASALLTFNPRHFDPAPDGLSVIEP